MYEKIKGSWDKHILLNAINIGWSTVFLLLYICQIRYTKAFKSLKILNENKKSSVNIVIKNNFFSVTWWNYSRVI